jgi:predicted DNA-binding protein
MGRKKSESISISIRFPKDVYGRLKAQAELETRSVSQQVVHYVRQALEGMLKREDLMYKKYEEKEKKIQRGDG